MRYKVSNVGISGSSHTLSRGLAWRGAFPFIISYHVTFPLSQLTAWYMKTVFANCGIMSSLYTLSHNVKWRAGFLSRSEMT